MSGPDPYLEGTRVAARCPTCRQPMWILYHGNAANHTIEPRLIEAINAALDELGQIENGTPAPVANAIDALRDAVGAH